MKKDKDIYRTLQQYFDTMPIGFPKTRSGVELRLLQHFFSPEEAEVALAMDFTPRTAKEIQERLSQTDFTLQEVEKRIRSMAEKGSVLTKNLKGEERAYAAMPFVLGMHEMQLPRLTPEYLQNLSKFMNEGFGLEYISTAVPQSRIIPIEESITTEHAVATYNDVRNIIENADPIYIGECICRKASEMAGSPCSITHRKEVCMGFGDFAAAYSEFLGFGRKISKEEALAILRQNEEDGLVLQPSNQQEPYFICSCCGDCCGLLKMAKSMPRPADFISSNYFARVDSELCNGCGKCVLRCQMDAIQMKNEKAVMDERRCIGCGVCVASCPTKARSLVKKEKETVPPKTEADYYELLAVNKKSKFQKLMTGIKAKMGIPQ